MAQASTPEELLDELGTAPGINITQVNETTYLFVLQPAGNLGAAPNSQLAADAYGSNSGYTCN